MTVALIHLERHGTPTIPPARMFHPFPAGTPRPNSNGDRRALCRLLFFLSPAKIADHQPAGCGPDRSGITGCHEACRYRNARNCSTADKGTRTTVAHTKLPLLGRYHVPRSHLSSALLPKRFVANGSNDLLPLSQHLLLQIFGSEES